MGPAGDAGDAQVKPHEPPKSCNTKWPRRDWRRLDERIEQVTKEIDVLAHGSESCRQLMTVPGIGPLIASAMVAAVANGAALPKDATLPPGLAWCRSRCRPVIGRSLGASASAAIVTHAVHAGRPRDPAQTGKLDKA
jgi:transposase